MNSGIWNLKGTSVQNEIIHTALHRCKFPFDLLKPSLLQWENKTQIDVTWEDLSRFSERASQRIRAHNSQLHTVERVLEGRRQVLGLFYLPPHTAVVLHKDLERYPELAAEVFMAEAAHAVDYHYMTPEMRRLVTNILHWDDLPPGADTNDGVAFTLDGHTCSWFDVGPYEDWVGEAMMEAFTEAFTDIPTTMSLTHPTGPAQAMLVAQILLPQAAPESPVTPPEGDRVSEVEGALIVELDRLLDNRSGVPKRFRKAAEAWLTEKGKTR